MPIPTEPIGSIPRPQSLIDGTAAFSAGRITRSELDALHTEALRDTLHHFEATGSPVITDGEQSKPSFATYPIHGLENLASDGVVIPFADGHTRQLPTLTSGPFRFSTFADSYLKEARQHTNLPLKQAVISASALSLLYPANGIEGYSQEDFIADLLAESAADIRRCLQHGAHAVQIDFTEGRLSLKLDPSKGLLRNFVALNNQALESFTDEERKRIGVHTCPGGDHDSTHSADVDYADLLPDLFKLNVGNFYVQLASESDPARVLGIIRDNLQPGQRVFVGVTDPIDPRIETPEEVRDRVLQAAQFVPLDQLGTTDDCGFSPFGDDVSTARETAFAKIRARVEGTRLAAERLGV
ncbi:MAG TPA: cobalamin-independent methionine synthase II family protein [Candidatus Kapabacteria bacterium]|nr:cobalamin-independent methionine synthase II family protein [Candidatus Kapabacteria bacterium]